MARYRFKTNKVYPARLLAVEHRPIENERGDVDLVRVVFEMFEASGDSVRAIAELASRDLVVHAGVEQDRGVMRLARALGVSPASHARHWVARVRRHPWITIQFGELQKPDFRQPFVDVVPWQPAGRNIIESEAEAAEQFVKVRQAALLLGMSDNTIRRWVDARERKFGDKLVRYTRGRHRLINWDFLRRLVD